MAVSPSSTSLRGHGLAAQAGSHCGRRLRRFLQSCWSAQMQNQDPLSPMDSARVARQMAQQIQTGDRHRLDKLTTVRRA